jgi:hypothetical protein
VSHWAERSPTSSKTTGKPSKVAGILAASSVGGRETRTVMHALSSFINSKILETGTNGYIIKSKRNFAMCQVGLYIKDVFVNFVCRLFCSLAGCFGKGYIQTGFGFDPQEVCPLGRILKGRGNK